MYEQRDTSVPRKHHADHRDRGNWSTAKTRHIHRVVYSFNESLVYILGSMFTTRLTQLADV